MNSVSTGLRTSAVPRFLPSASASVRIPTLPAYISKISTICESTPREGVMPRLTPTVPIAETVSNRTDMNPAVSAAQMINVPVSAINRYAAKMASACVTSSGCKRRFPILISFLPRNAATIPIIITANVLTLIPPAVEPELPPININTTVNRYPLSESSAGSVVEKPAVRAVAELKIARSSFSPKGAPLYEAFHSNPR